MQQRYPRLGRDLVETVVRRHGTRAKDILGDAKSIGDLGRHFGAGLTERAVEYLRREEWAQTAEDVLDRRTKAYLHLTEDVIIERITGRRMCLSCGKIYHVRTLPPVSPGICDVCGSQLTQRTDDTEEVVKNRLVFYQKVTEPLVDYYRESGKLVSLNASLGSEDAYVHAAQALES
jgi:adenylate kinase